MDVNGQLSSFAESLVLSSALAFHCYRGNVKQYGRFYHVIGTQQIHEVLHSERNLTETGMRRMRNKDKALKKNKSKTSVSYIHNYAPVNQEAVFQLGQNRRVLRPSCPLWRPSCPPLVPLSDVCSSIAVLCTANY